MTLSVHAKKAIAEKPRPETGSAEYQRWRKCRIALGLWSPHKKTQCSRKEYLRKYIKAYRKIVRSCNTCGYLYDCHVFKAVKGMVCARNDWHCSDWKKARRIKVIK